jgi:hypothetical protein
MYFHSIVAYYKYATWNNKEVLVKSQDKRLIYKSLFYFYILVTIPKVFKCHLW